MPSFRKRVFSSAFNKNGSSGMFKKRRFIRRRRFAKKTGGKRTFDYTSLNLRGHASGFRGRKITRRAFQKHVWNSTTFKPHYRSIQTESTNFSTPIAVTDGTIQFFNMYKFGGVGFGTVAGGAREIDVGAGVPTFEESSFVLRGGKYTMTIASSVDIKVKLFRITTGNNPNFSIVPATEDEAWDPSATPDFFVEVGKPFMTKEVTIEGGNSYTFVTRFKTQKIDGQAYIDNARSPYICLLVSAVSGIGGSIFTVKQSYNLSFSADAI